MTHPDIAGVDIARLAEQYRGRAQKYEHTAKVYLRIIIGVLSACILIFAGADRLAGALFKTAAEREAEALQHQSEMQILRNLSAVVEQMRSSIPAQVEAPQPGASTAPAIAPAPAAGAVFRPLPDPRAGAAGAAAAVEKTPAPNEALRRTVKQLYADNAALQQELVQARDRLGEEADRLAVEQVRKEAAVEVAQIRANADDARASVDREVAQAKADAERAVAEDFNALIASSVARVGAAVIVVLLVRIFLRDRQRLILLAGFYAGLADALEISAGDPSRLREWLPQLVPPAMAAADDVATPIETVMQAVVELAKRSRA